MQVVGVEAVAEVDGQCEWPEIPGGPQASADRGQAVATLPCMLMTFCELADTHVARLEDYMLCVIQLPILRQDTSLTFKSRVQWRPREWRQHGEARQVDARIDGEFNRGVEDIRRVVIQPKNEAALDRNTQMMKVSDHLLEIDGAVETLLCVLQTCRGDRLQSEQQPLATAACNQFHELPVVRNQYGG